jgi:hypothetical protein
MAIITASNFVGIKLSLRYWKGLFYETFIQLLFKFLVYIFNEIVILQYPSRAKIYKWLKEGLSKEVTATDGNCPILQLEFQHALYQLYIKLYDTDLYFF